MRIGIILAGGRSTRFGRSKLTAAIAGRSLLEWSIDALVPVVDSIIVAVREIPEGTIGRRCPVAFVQDARPFAGPFAALANVLGTVTPDADADLVVVVGGDMPGLVSEVLRAMLARLDGDRDVDGLFLKAPSEPGSPPVRRSVLPLAIRVGPARAAAQAGLAAGERSLQSFVDRLRTVELPAEEWLALDPSGRTLLDVDTRSDLERIRRTFEARELDESSA